MPYCPLQQVTADYPPTLLLHGDRDTYVPYVQSVLMAAALTDAGVAHELITILEGEHGFDAKQDDPQVGAAFVRVLRFLNQHSLSNRPYKREKRSWTQNDSYLAAWPGRGCCHTLYRSVPASIWMRYKRTFAL